MDKKKLSPKEIFRTLAFHYHLQDVISVELLAQMVSSLYYPNQLDQISIDARQRYKKLLISFMKQYNNQQKNIDQEKFVKFMTQMTKHSNDEYLRKLTDRIFNRYSNHQEDVIEQQGFARLGNSFGIAKEQSKDYFLSIADLKNQITRQKFQEYMGALASIKK